MSRIERWWSEDPRRPPAEYACLMARDRFWRDPQRRLIALHPDLDGDSFYAEQLLSTDALLAHALALSLSRLPVEARRGFADAFYAERRSRRPAWSHPLPPRERLARAASIALLVADLADTDGLGERVLDLLQGAAQGDDPELISEPALAELRKTVARIRLDVDYDDPADPHGAAALAVAEVLDPSSEAVDVQEVLARATWATVESRERAGTLAFLLEVDSLFADAA